MKSWKLENGNIALSYDMREPMGNKWIIVLVGVLFVLLALMEFVFLGTWYSVLPLCVLFFFVFIYWAFYPCKYNDQIEKSWMNHNIDLRLHNELKKYGKHVHEVKRKFVIDTKGTYGIVTGTYMLVLLSNGIVLEYELKYHKPDESNDAYCEFVKNPVKCTNEEHLKKIQRFSWKRLLRRVANSEIIHLNLIFVSFFLISACLIGCLLWVFVHFSFISFIGIISYILIYIAIKTINKKRKNIVLGKIAKLLSLPFILFGLWIKIAQPATVIIFSYFFLVMIVFFLPLILFQGLSLIGFISISIPTKIFLTFIIGSILSVHCPNIIRKLVKNYSPLRNWENHKYEAIQEELSLYVLHPSNICFFLYFIYFVILAISGYTQIQYHQPLITTDIDNSILKAFLVFIAFTNMRGKSKEVELDSKELLTKMIKLINS